MSIGYDYCEIPLTQGVVVKISPHRFKEIAQKKYYAAYSVTSHAFYAMRTMKSSDGKYRKLAMHREIMGLMPGDKRGVDHINHDTLDNRDENLRIVSKMEQSYNRGRLANNKSGYKNVFWEKKTQKYRATIRANGVRVSLGYRDDPREAFEELVIPAIEKYHGEFGCTDNIQRNTTKPIFDNPRFTPVLIDEGRIGIRLTKGKIAVVSVEDYAQYGKCFWNARWSPMTKSFYAVRTEHLPNGNTRSVLLHREILGLKYGDKRCGDHINHDTLNNTRENLRITTDAENKKNKKPRLKKAD
jgi:HNH endonuclease